MAQDVARSSLNLLFRHALETGKRARTETAIARSTASVSHAAVEMAEEIIGSLAGSRVLVLGAGEMGEGVATALAKAGAQTVVVNRTAGRGEALAGKVGARVAPFAELGAELAGADVVVSCTGAGDVVLTRGAVEEARAGAMSPLLIVDIALPRDVDPSVAVLAGVTLRDLDHLNEWAARGLSAREAEVDDVRAIISEEVERFVLSSAQRQAAPLVAQLREAVEETRQTELARFSARLAQLGDEEREVIETITRSIVAKMLHTPSVRLREAAGTPQGERLSAAVRDLFNLH
jgi:glutamyl-tRNA reductase